MLPASLLELGFAAFLSALALYPRRPPKRVPLALAPFEPTKPIRRPPAREHMPLFSPIRGANRTSVDSAQEWLLADPGPLFELAGVHWPALGYLNKVVLLSGRPGTGKTVSMKMLMASLGSLFSQLKMRWLVIDPTNGYLSYLYQVLPENIEIIRSTPQDELGASWEIRKDITSDSLNNALQTALFPDALFKKAGDPFWYHKAREVTESEVTVYLDRSSEWRFADLIIPIKFPQFLRPLLAQSPRTRGMVDHELVGKLGRDIVATTSSVINRMAVAAALWQRATKTFSLRSFLNRQDAVLHLGFRPDLIPSLAGIANAMTYMLILMALEGDDETDFTYMCLDEGRFLDEVTGLPLIGARGRGAGLGAAVTCQGTPGLIASWGNDKVKELLDTISAWTTFGAGIETAQAFSKFVGQIEGVERSYGISTSEGTSHSFGRNSGGSSGLSGPSSSWGKNFSVTHSTNTTYSENFKLSLRDAILPSEITGLGRPVDGVLKGFTFNPDVGLFQFDAPFLDHFESLGAPPFRGIPARPDSDQRLLPWTTEDLQRLRLELTPEFMEALRVTWGASGGVT